MKAIDFIQADTRRLRIPTRTLVCISALLIFISLTLGLLTREGFTEAFDLRNLLPAVSILLVVALFPWIYTQQQISLRRRSLIFLGLWAFAFTATLIQPQTTVSLEKFSPADSFWPETWHCLWLGFVSSLVASVFLNLLTVKILPTPNQMWQKHLSILAGVCGLAALTLHCMGSLTSHTIIAHWGQALIIFPIAYWQQRLIFTFRMRRIFKNNKNIRQIENISNSTL